MSTINFYDFLSDLLNSEQKPLVLPALRQDSLIITGLQTPEHVENLVAAKEYLQNHFTPGDFAIAAVYPNMAAISEVPLDTQTLERLMTDFEAFKQAGAPAEFLTQAVDVALALIEKRKIATHWKVVLADALRNRNGRNDADLAAWWNTPLAIASHLDPHRDELLDVLTQADAPLAFLTIFVHCVLTQPVEPNAKVRQIANALSTQSEPRQIVLLNLLQNQAGEQFTADAASVLLESSKVAPVSPASPGEVWSKPADALNQVTRYQNLGTVAQLAHKDAAALEFVEAAEKTLGAIKTGLNLQKLALLSRLDRKEETNALASRIMEEEPANSDVASELMMALEPKAPADLGIKTTQPEAPVAGFVQAKSIEAAGNLPLAREAAANAFSALIAQPDAISKARQPRFAHNFNLTRLFDTLVHFGLNDEATVIARKILAENPSNFAVIEKSAPLFLQAGDYSEALDLYRNLEVLDPASTQIKRAKALSLEALGDDEAALRAWSAFTPNAQDATEDDLLHLARTANKVGNVHAAIQAASAIPETSTKYGKALVVLGKSYRKLGDIPQAIEYLAKAIETEVDEAEPWLALADLYARNGEPERSADTLRAAKSVFPESKEILFALAKRLIDQGSPSEALTMLNELITQFPDYLPGQILTVKTMKSVNHEGADEKIDELARLFPESAEVNYLVGERFLKTGMRGEAQNVLSKAVEIAKPDAEWLVAYADSLAGEDYRSVDSNEVRTADHVDKAKKALEQSARVESDALAAAVSGELLLSEGNATEAFRILSTVESKQVSPDDEWYWRLQAGLARAATILGKFDMALASIQDAISQQPGLAGLHKILADVHKASGNTLAAVEAANQVLVIAPNVVENVLWFVNFLSGLNRPADAEKELQKAIATKPAEIKYRIALAELLTKSGRASELSTTLGTPEALLQTRPAEADLVKAAEIYWSNGDTKSAAILLEKRAQDFSGSIQAKLDYAGILAQTGNAIRSNEILSALVAEPAIALIAAEARYQESDFDAAAILLESSPETSKPEGIAVNSFLPAAWQIMLQQKHPAEYLGARVHFAKANFKKTVEICKKWHSAESDNANASFYLDQAHCAIGADMVPHKIDHLETAPVMVLCAMAQENLDSGNTDRGMGLIERAAENGGDGAWISALRIQAAVARGELIEAQVNEGELASTAMQSAVCVKAEDIVRCSSHVHANIALNHWDAALDLASALKQSNPANLEVAALHLQTLVSAIEAAHAQQCLEIKAHAVSASRLDSIEKEFAEIHSSMETPSSKSIARWLIRGQLALQPSQENLRALALISPKPDDIVAMMSALHALDDDQTAVQVAHKFENHPAVLAELAKCQAATDDNTALLSLQRSLLFAEGQPEIWAARSILEEKLGEKENAIQSMENALSYWPDEAGWHIRAARLWQSAGDPKKAVEHLQNSASLENDNAEIEFQIGSAYASLNQFAESIRMLEQASSKDMNRSDILEALADVYYRSGNLDKAIKTAERASISNPFSVKPILLTGEIELEKGEIAKALEQARIAISKNETSAEAITFLAKVLLKKGDKAQALAALEKAASSENATLDLMLKHAHLVREIKGSSNSKAIFEGLVKRYPQNTELLKLLAESQLDCGEKVAAEETARHSLRLESAQPDLHEFLGKLKIEDGNLDQAVYHFSEEIALDASAVNGYLELAKVYQKRRDFHKALETLQQAIDAVPTDSRAFVACAGMFREARDYSSAETMLRKAAVIDPHDINIKRQLGAVIALNLVHKSQQASSQL